MMGRVGIVTALSPEARSLERTGAMTHAEVVVSGMGAADAGEAAERLCSRGAKALLSWGCAGGLAPGLPAGALMLPGVVRSCTGECFVTDPRWRRPAVDLLRRGRVPTQTGPLGETRHILRRAEEKRRAFEASGTMAVDMESAAVAAVARDAGVPFLAVRAIADTWRTTIPTGDRLTGGSLATAVRSVLCHPGGLPSALRLGWDFRAALRTLRLAAEVLGADFACPAVAAGGAGPEAREEERLPGRPVPRDRPAWCRP